jgi:hypothetical protein
VSTYTTYQLSKLHGLDELDEMICGMYGQDFYLAMELETPDRERLYRYLDRTVEHLRNWREQYGEVIQ